MKPEARSSYLEIREGDSVPERWDGFRVGSETCPQLLPSLQNLRRLSGQGDPGRLSLVTPVAGPEEAGDVLNAAAAAESAGWGEVVVNDWGVLSELGGTKGIGITAGRLLMRYRRGPGIFDPWDELDPATRRYFAWGPLYDSPFLAFLRGKGVNRIELDLPRHWLPLPDLDGFRFSLHRHTRLISVSAACPWLYDEKKGTWGSLAQCGRICSKQKDILMTSAALKGSLFLRGRAICEVVDADPDKFDLPDAVDRVIFDRKS